MLTCNLFNSQHSAWMPKAEAALKGLSSQNVPLLGLFTKTSDIEECQKEADRIREWATHVVIVGTGGSSLGARTLYELRPANAKSPEFHFLENVDPEATETLFTKLDWAKTAFLFISKSGGTLETLSQMLLVLRLLSKLGPDAISKQCLCISDPKPSSLRKIADSLNIRVLDHEANIGGRFSVLTNVGLLPAAIAGLDIAALRKGASQFFPSILTESVAWHMALMSDERKLHVLMPYSERLACFTSWHRQLWAESLGKSGKGSTPVRALGTVDQHSQIQLYLAGPKDKGFTFLSLQSRIKGPALWPNDLNLPALPEIAYLKNKSLGQILEASESGTIETFKAKKLPGRVIFLPDTSEQTIGALLMHFMLETILTASVLGVDPYDQPAVEDGKILARKMLESEK